MIFCFYHSADFDGHCSAAIVKSLYNDCKLIPINYGIEYDFEKIPQHSTVIVCDYSFSREITEMLNQKYYFIWIDHHISAIKLNEGLEIKGIRDLKYSGCELTWKYLYPEKNMPEAVFHLGRYDSWNHDDDPDAFSFHYGMQTYKTDVRDNYDFWDQLIIKEDKNLISDILSKGLIINDFVDINNEYLCKMGKFECEIAGFKGIALIGVKGSLSFKSIWDQKKYDMMVAITFNKSKWNVSLYSDKENIHCEEICAKFGGGGHQGAAGFVIPKENLWEVIKIIISN